MKIKICGITTLDDALAAIDAGADLLGFNFYPKSPRYIEQANCAALVNRLRGRGERATLVGVFVNIAADAVAACLDACNLDYAQLHGDEPPEDLAALAPWAFKAIRPASTEEAKRQALRYLPAAPDGYDTLVADPPRPAFLLDAAAPGQFGGSGQAGGLGYGARAGATMADPAGRRSAPRQRRRGGRGRSPLGRRCGIGRRSQPRAKRHHEDAGFCRGGEALTRRRSRLRLRFRDALMLRLYAK